MKSSTKTYLWIILLIVIFLSGFGFIYWMGNTNEKTNIITDISSELDISTDIIENPTLSPAPAPDTVLNAENAEETSELCPTLLIKRGNQLMLFNKNMPEISGENPVFFNSLDQYVKYIKMQRELYGQTCPVLFLQEETNAQGDNVYRMRKTHDGAENIDPLLLGSMENYFKDAVNVAPKFQPPRGPDAFNKPTSNQSVSLALHGTPIQDISKQTHPIEVPYVDANRSNPEYNQGFYGFDPSNQYVGQYTVLDQIHHSTQTQNKDGLSDNAMDPNWGGTVFTQQKVEEGKYEGHAVEPPTTASILDFGSYPKALDDDKIPTPDATYGSPTASD